MVSTSTVFFFFFYFCMMFLVDFSCFASSTEARKLLRVQEILEKKMVPSSTEEAKSGEYERLYLNALPKGNVPASTPSNKGHAQIIDEKLIARHLVAVDRILRSVPSPGVGH